MITFPCPGCHKQLQVADDSGGKRAKCPHCGHVAQVPAANHEATLGVSLPPPAHRGPAPAAGSLEKTRAAVSPAASSDRPAGKPDFLAPAEQADELGRLGGYRVLKVLGQGGMGMVFQAEDVQLQRLVALKVMKPELAQDEPARQRFLREARATAALKNDHVVSIYQVGQDNAVPFLAMEFLEGEPLDRRLEREGKLPVAEVLRIGREAAVGLAAAHARGLVHRDIKPANLWLEAGRGRVKILDFGLARTAQEDMRITQSGAVVGTPNYMAPEQARGEEVDHRGDLFSLGCVLYRLATGMLPFRGSSTMAVLTALALDTPTPLAQLNPTVPPALAELVMRLLAKNPGERPASAQEVVTAIEAIERLALPAAVASSATPPASARSDPETLALSPAAALRCRRGRSRGLLLAGAAVALLVLLLVGGIVLFGPSRDKPQPGPAPEDGGPPVAEPGNQPLPDKEKPFVRVRGKAGPRSEFKTLADALKDLRDGDTIEVHGNGPFTIGKVQAMGTGLTLRAAPGYRPRFFADPILVLRPTNWFLVEQSPFQLEGCDFYMPTEITGFKGGGAPWEIQRCRFLCWGGTTTIAYTGPKLRVADCLVSKHSGTNGPLVELGPTSDVELTNNIVCEGDSVIRFQEPGGQTVRLRNNTVAGNVLSFWFRRYTEPFTVEAEGNVFHCRHGSSLSRSPADADLKRCFRWRGRFNLYGAKALYSQSQDTKQEIKSVADWNKFWGREEEGSREVPPSKTPDLLLMHYAWQDLLDLPPEQQVARGRQVTEAARQHHQLGPWGPNWAVIGPGDGYVHALAAAGRPVPPEELRPPPYLGSPIVQLRGGKVIRGFVSLREAIGVASGGDVIEIRSDQTIPLQWGFRSEADRELTLRAAPGYRPTVEGSLGFQGQWTLAVEGIGFRSDGNHCLAVEGRITRLANCSFLNTQRNGPPAVRCAFQTRDGKPGEIVNCLIPDECWATLLPSGRVQVRNSLLGGLHLLADQEGDCSVELDRCVLWNPGLGFRVGNTLGVALGRQNKNIGRVSVHAQQTLFETGNGLCNLGLNLQRWSGQRNVYHVGRRMWIFGATPPTPTSLGDWQQLWKSDADSVEAEPLDYDPRQWRLLPSSPGYRKGPGGKDYGADVDQVASPLLQRATDQ